MATFLTTIGSKTYVLRDLLAPAKPSEVKLEVLVKTLRDHYEMKLIVIKGQFHFHKCEQHVGEGVAVYSIALKKCSEHCAFRTFLDEALRDRFVCGLRSKQTQKRFSVQKEVTRKAAVEIVLGMEVADKQADNFRNSPEDGGIDHVKPPHPPTALKQRKLCCRCGENHIPQKCQFKDENCRNCKSKGHIAKVAKRKFQPHIQSRIGNNLVQCVETGDQTPNDQDNEFKLSQISQEKPEPSIMVPVKVSNKDCSMELSTGASISIMSEEAWKERFPQLCLRSPK